MVDTLEEEVEVVMVVEVLVGEKEEKTEEETEEVVRVVEVWVVKKEDMTALVVMVEENMAVVKGEVTVVAVRVVEI